MKKILTLTLLAATTLTNLIFAQQKDVNFDKKYIKSSNQNTTIEINEVQELIYIIFSITDFGKNNPNMTNQKTKYFDEVLQHFSKFSNHPIVSKFDEQLNQNIVNYFILAGNAYGFKFDGNKIKPTNVYNFPAKGIGKFHVESNPILSFISDLEDFVEISEYRKFYKNHQAFYNDLKDEYQKYATISEQKMWLENKFDYKINSYRVLTSPLIAGMNATHTFEDNNFKETLLFLPTIRKNEEWSEKFRKAINIRTIFTEIDHNYVGPLSEKYTERINLIFNNRDKWVNQENKSTAHYPNPIKVYDEYLTWGLFILYSYDNFGNDTELFNQIVENVNDMMVNKKGFPKAVEFNAELLKLYKMNKEKNIESLYNPLLNWSANQ